jgi:gamma-glutamylcyclotransferase
LYYFAYGSNMNWDQMRRRCPSAQFISVGRLPGYRFAIARHSRLRKCGTANIYADDGGEVWGIVYEVNEEDLARLDNFEDGYSRTNVIVCSSANGQRPIKALVYIAPKEDNAPLPNAEYKQLMLEGALYWRLPHPYCVMLESIAAREI